MSETPATPAPAPQEENRPAARKVRRPWMTWIKLFLLCIIVICLNYVGCHEYYRRDLTEDQRYDISQQSINMLQSPEIQNRKTPIKITFAFLRTTQNYTRMRSLLEEYERYSNGKVVVDYVDPLRQPNKAREISMIYGVEFRKNQVVIDAREDTEVALKDSAGNYQPDAAHVRILSGDSFIVYAPGPDGKSMKAVALQIEDMMTAGIFGAANGEPRKMYIAADKSNFNEAMSNSNEESIFTTLSRLCRSVNLQLVPIRLGGLQEIPEDAAGFMIVGSKYDLTPQEAEVLQRYWDRPNAALFIMLEPQQDTPKQLYRFLREQGLRPQNDRVMLRNRNKRSVFEINAIFAPGLNCTKEFWNSSTGLEGESISLILDSDNASMEHKRITPYPLLVTTEEYYGETKYNQFPVQFDALEDNPGPLMIGAALIRGNSGDVNQTKTTGRLVLLGNTDLLQPRQIKPEQRDFVRTLIAWMTDREELRGLGSRHDLTVKLNLDRNALGVLELLTNIGLPLLALLIALIIWNTRRH